MPYHKGKKLEKQQYHQSSVQYQCLQLTSSFTVYYKMINSKCQKKISRLVQVSVNVGNLSCCIKMDQDIQSHSRCHWTGLMVLILACIKIILSFGQEVKRDKNDNQFSTKAMNSLQHKKKTYCSSLWIGYKVSPQRFTCQSLSCQQNDVQRCRRVSVQLLLGSNGDSLLDRLIH